MLHRSDHEERSRATVSAFTRNHRQIQVAASTRKLENNNNCNASVFQQHQRQQRRLVELMKENSSASKRKNLNDDKEANNEPDEEDEENELRASEARKAADRALRELNFAVDSWRKATGSSLSSSSNNTSPNLTSYRTRSKSLKRQQEKSRESPGRDMHSYLTNRRLRPTHSEHQLNKLTIHGQQPKSVILVNELSGLDNIGIGSNSCSSGFSTMISGSSNSSGLSATNERQVNSSISFVINNAHDQHQHQSQARSTSTRSLRKRLIEGLEQLEQLAAGAANERQPNGINSKSNNSPQMHQQEFAYSTLCRDEFSSFIAMTNESCEDEQDRSGDSKQVAAIAAAGPMLVGVHECETPPPACEPLFNVTNEQIAHSMVMASSSPEEERETTTDEEHMMMINQNNSSREFRRNVARTTNSSSGLCSSTESNTSCDSASGSNSPATSRSRIIERVGHLEDECCHVKVEEFLDDSEAEYDSGEGGQKLRHQIERDSLESSVKYSKSPACNDEAIYEEIIEHRECPQEANEPSDIAPKSESNLSAMLELYLQRVDSLLRLAQGDKSVTMNDAFGCENERGQICVDQQWRTGIGFVDCEPKNVRPTRVIQDFEFETSASSYSGEDEDFSEESKMVKKRKVRLTKIIRDNFRSLANTSDTRVPSEARINWWPSSEDYENSHSLSSARQESRNCSGNEKLVQDLVQSILERWLELSGQKDANSSASEKNLVQTISRHTIEFLENLSNYREAKMDCQESIDEHFRLSWNSNWMFASGKRPNDSFSTPDNNNNKRVKLMFKSYANLVAEKHNKRLSKQQANYLATKTTLSRADNSIEAIYLMAAEEQENELVACSAQRRTLVDVCRLMLDDIFDSDDEQQYCNNKNNSNGKHKKSLSIRYGSSSTLAHMVINWSPSLSFAAFGYLFESDNLNVARNLVAPESLRSHRRLEQLRESILKRMAASVVAIPNNPIETVQQRQDQVRFNVSISSVELSRAWPVIQFCAKISGALPIKVSWFKIETEPAINGDGNRASRRVERCLTDDLNCRRKISFSKSHEYTFGDENKKLDWPITMNASFDFEYQNVHSLSWYRFRRRQDELIFEIRQASELDDFNKKYKCVVRNYRSERECEFELKLRPPKPADNLERQKTVGKDCKLDEAKSSRRNLSRLPIRDSQQDSCAIMRTWSQRTLNRPAASERSAGEKFCQDNSQVKVQADGMLSLSKSASSAANACTAVVSSCNEMDKFGCEFPYHPASLMKRLEANKYSLTLRSRLTKSSLRSGGQFGSDESRAIENGAFCLHEVMEFSSSGKVEAEAKAARDRPMTSHHQQFERSSTRGEQQQEDVSRQQHEMELGFKRVSDDFMGSLHENSKKDFANGKQDNCQPPIRMTTSELGQSSLGQQQVAGKPHVRPRLLAAAVTSKATRISEQCQPSEGKRSAQEKINLQPNVEAPDTTVNYYYDNLRSSQMYKQQVKADDRRQCPEKWPEKQAKPPIAPRILSVSSSTSSRRQASSPENATVTSSSSAARNKASSSNNKPNLVDIFASAEANKELRRTTSESSQQDTSNESAKSSVKSLISRFSR